MSWNNRIRQAHRWVSIAFTLAVIITTAALATGKAPDWINYIALPPLAILLFSGLYLFAQPYIAKRRARALATGTGV